MTKVTNVIVGAALVAALMPSRLPAQSIRPHQGLTITYSVRIAPGVYRLAAPASLDSALITVRGNDIVVDFSGVTLQGAAPGDDPDLGAGVAIRVEGGRNIRIRGLHARGYKVGILARGTRGLTIENADLSYNWKPRLFSLVEHESLADWLSFHHNEHGEWLRFGAAIYLDGVTGGAIRGNRAVQGMNALLMNRSDHLRIENNDFSFNSGLGIGLYRSSDNTIVYNTVEFDVRGYSHGFYRRGQDSANILMYEQSCRNLVGWNAATHGGDGLFLWAGQSTMDSGQGGANDNLFFGNDFSWAPANGIEATFSRNAFVSNLLEGNEYGVWGGYSFSSHIVGNRFVRNRTGIAIEHGQDNAVAANLFDHDSTAVYLWATPIEPSDWGYPRFRDTRSRDGRIEGNTFMGNRVGVRAVNTAGLAVTQNRWTGVDSFAVLRDTSGARVADNVSFDRAAWPRPELTDFAGLVPDSIGGRRVVPATPLARRDRSTIVVDEWGPYDWQSPKLRPLDSTRAVPLRLAVLGPAGTWRVVGRRGLAIVSKESGRTGDTIAVAADNASVGDWELALAYRGGATVSPQGARRGRGVPYRFSYGRFEPPVLWGVRFFVWGDSSHPRDHPDGFAALLRGTPLLTRVSPRLDYMWYRPTIAGLPVERWGLEATAIVELPPGTYALRTISDDGVRVWIDGELVIDDWSHHESTVDTAPVAAGRHDVKVQYYQEDGWTELRLDIVRGLQRSQGSPGPH